MKTPELSEAVFGAQQELARRSLLYFAKFVLPRFEPAPHLRLLADHLEALERRDINRLIVAMPPRHGKSWMSSQIFPAWVFGRRPSEDVVLASYGSRLAEENSRGVRELVKHERYPFDVTMAEDQRAVGRWSTSGGGLMIAAGVRSSLTGFGADLLVIDDPFADRQEAESEAIRQSTWEWYQDVARTRLHKNAVQIVISTRWHQDDIVGRILDSPGASSWKTLVLPAISEGQNDPLGRPEGDALWPSHFPVEDLPSVERGETSSRSFAALYQQQPVPAAGNAVKVDWFANRYTTLPPAFTRIVVGMDTASKVGIRTDFSAIVKLGATETGYYVLDAWHARVEFPDLVRRVKALETEDLPPDTLYCEDASSGIALIQVLRDESRLPIVPIVPKGSKESRVEGITGTLEAQRVFLPDEAPWLADFERDLFSFPAGKHDDLTDAFVLALSQLVGRSGEIYFADIGTDGSVTRAYMGDEGAQVTEEVSSGAVTLRTVRYADGRIDRTTTRGENG